MDSFENDFDPNAGYEIPSTARITMAQALAGGSSPEETAQNIQLGRQNGVNPSLIAKMTPEQKAMEKSRSIDWDAIQSDSPILYQKLSDAIFANLVKDDPRQAGLVEKLWWKISPEIGERGWWWQTARNALARGGYRLSNALPLLGNERILEDSRKELQGIAKTEQQLSSGVAIADIFGDEEDPTGTVGYQNFLNTKDKTKTAIMARMNSAAIAMAWSNRMQSLFPRSAAFEELQNTKDAFEAFAVLAKNPITLALDVGVESAVNQLPQLAALAAGAGFGTIPAAFAAGIGSYNAEYGSRLASAMTENGLNSTVSDDILKWYASGEYADKFNQAMGKARTGAAATAVFDAISGGLATKGLLPKAWRGQRLGGSRRFNVGEIAAQAVVQGALGGAGEASSQVATEGRITNWADIVAEIAGEFTTAPVEVASAALGRRILSAEEKQMIQSYAQATERLSQFAQVAPLLARDPQTFSEYMAEIARAKRSGDVIIDVQALHQAGADDLFSADPELNKRFQTALENGEELRLKPEEVLTKVAPNDKANVLATVAHPENLPSLAEAQAMETQIVQESAERLSEVLQNQNEEFRRSSAEVGATVGQMLTEAFNPADGRVSEGNMTANQISVIQAYYQTMFTTLAKDLGMLPKEVFDRYGPMVFFGNKDVKRGPNGELLAVSDRAKKAFSEKDALRAFNSSKLYAAIAAAKSGNSGALIKEVSLTLQSIGEPVPKDLQKFKGSWERKVNNVAIGDIRVSTRSEKEFRGEAFKFPEELLGLPYLEETLKSGSFSGWVANKKKAKKPSVISYGVLSKTFTVNGVAFTVKATVEKFANGDILYFLKTNPKVYPQKETAKGTKALGRTVTVHSPTDSLAGLETNSTLSIDFLQGVRQGSLGEYLPDYRAIIQWAGSNRSTFLHETGHMYLDARVRIAQDLMKKREGGITLTKGETHVLEATESALKWLGTDIVTFAGMSVDQQRPMHEKFARSYEAYLMEGSAPNKGLTKIFRSFSAWLRGVYASISVIPDAELNDEVREMFDTLFSASSQVEEARQRRAQFSRFSNPEAAAIAQELGEDFAELQNETVNEAIEEQNARLARAALRIKRMREGKIEELTDFAKKKFNELYDEIWAQTMESRAYKAHVMLSEGINGRKPKLTKTDLKGLKLTQAQLDMLEDMEMTGDGSEGNGTVAAEALGYDSVDALVRDVLELGDPVNHVRDLTTTRMEELYGDVSTPDKIARTAEISLFNDARVRILGIEAAALNKAVKGLKEFLAPFRENAKAIVGAIKLADLKKEAASHSIYAGRNHREAETAFRNGDTKAAAFAKNNELKQAILVRTIKLAIEEARKGYKLFDRFKGEKVIKGLNTSYLMAIQHILDCIGYAKFPEEGSRQRVSLAQFISAVNARAESEESFEHVIDVDDELVRKIDSGEISHGDATVSQFAAITDLIKELNTLGRNVESIELEGKRVALDDARSECAGAVVDNANKRGRKELDGREKTGNIERIREALNNLGFSHFRIPSLLACIEGTRTGQFFKYIVRRADECGAKETNLKSVYAEALNEILKPMFKDLASQKKIYFENVGASFTKQEIFVMALNLGNEGNTQRLLDNSNGWGFMKGRKLTQDQVVEMISKTLTWQELNKVQKLWDLFDDLRDEIEAKEIRVRGRAPAWVESRPIMLFTSDGKVIHLRGGYYPIVYDKNASAMGEVIDASKGVLQEMKATQGSASTWKGHLKNRSTTVDQMRPLTLTLRGAYEGFDSAIHDVCWDEWVASTRRLLNGRVQDTIREYYGTQAVRAIRNWIKDIAVGRNNQTSQSDVIADALRKNVSLAGIGFNLVTAAIQPIGIVQSVAVLGNKWTLSGVSSFLTMNPRGAYEFCASKSLIMQDRMRTQFREIAEVQKFTSSGSNSVYDSLARMAYLPVMYSQMLVDIPTWLGGYKKALAEGKSDAEAIAVADRLLIDAQGSGRFQDLSGVERGNSWMKLFTVFYTFFNTTYNVCQVSARTEPKLKAARDLMLVLVAQPIIETFVREALKVRTDGGEGDDEYWERMQAEALKNVVGFSMGTIVGLREVADVFGSSMGYSGTAGTRKISDLYRLGNKVPKAYETWMNEDKIDPAFVRQFVTVFGEWSPVAVPVVPINRYLKGAEAISEGKTDDWKAYLLGFTDNY